MANYIIFISKINNMCLGVPAKILKIDKDEAIVEFGKVKRRVNIAFTPDVKPGEWVIVHTGFALQKLSKSIKEYEILFKG